MRTYDNIRKMTTDQGDDYTTGSLLDYPYFKEHYKLIVIDLLKQKLLEADQKAMRQISFTRNLDEAEKQILFSLLKKQEKRF